MPFVAREVSYLFIYMFLVSVVCGSLMVLIQPDTTVDAFSPPDFFSPFTKTMGNGNNWSFNNVYNMSGSFVFESIPELLLTNPVMRGDTAGYNSFYLYKDYRMDNTYTTTFTVYNPNRQPFYILIGESHDILYPVAGATGKAWIQFNADGMTIQDQIPNVYPSHPYLSQVNFTQIKIKLVSTKDNTTVYVNDVKTYRTLVFKNSEDPFIITEYLHGVGFTGETIYLKSIEQTNTPSENADYVKIIQSIIGAAFTIFLWTLPREFFTTDYEMWIFTIVNVVFIKSALIRMAWILKDDIIRFLGAIIP